MEHTTLWQITDHYVELGEHLDDPDWDEASLHAALDDLHDALGAKIDNIVGLMASWEATEKALQEEVQRLQNRKRMFENRRKRLRGYLKYQLTRLNQKRFETDFYTLSIRKGSEHVVIDDLDAVPEVLTRTKVEPVKPAIKKFLQDHGDCAIEWAHLERGPDSVVIK